MDLFEIGFVFFFVPPSRDNMHIIFRVQHSTDPSHQLVQEKSDPPCFTCVRELDGDEELTLDYRLYVEQSTDNR